MLKPTVIAEIMRQANTAEFRQNPCFYIYDLDDITEKLALIAQNRPSNLSVYYAMKANPNNAIMRHIHSKNLAGVEIASIGELQRAIQLYPSTKIIFTGPGKTEPELRASVDFGIRLINLESLVEAHRIQNYAEQYGKSVDVLVRINTDYVLEDSLASMTGESTKMGIEQNKLGDSLAHIRTHCPRLNVRGFHVFSASGVLDYKQIIDYVDYVFKLVQKIELNGTSAEIVDFGGGFGIDYSGSEKKFETVLFLKELQEKIVYYGFGKKELLLELGRYVVGESGYYVAQIIDIKDCRGKKHIVAAGGVNHLRLPSASGVNQPVYILPMNAPDVYSGQPFVNNELIDVGGPLCFAEDKIARDICVAGARIGDLVVVSKAGAYGYTVSSLELLGHPRPPEIIMGETHE